MNDPFSYQPHALCIAAAGELQRSLPEIMSRYPEERGKMFGVLVVRRGDDLGYLQAYSGQLGGSYPLTDDFVPPVYDYLAPTGHFKQTEREISAINHSLKAMDADNGSLVRERCQVIEACRDRRVEAWRKTMEQSKRRRDLLRPTADEETARRLVRESQYQKAQLRRIRERWTVVIGAVNRRQEREREERQRLIARRRKMSDSLQHWLFDRFVMRNGRGEEASIADIFAHYDPQRPYLTPPGGTGECCEPKLLQYAYRMGLRPLCMAMFWWGESPEGEIRHHLHYYPACQSKCRPVLSYMLQGIEVEDSDDAPDDHRLDIVYEDEWLVVVNKPAGMLSVPGRQERESVASIMRRRHPHATGPMVVHRLDMDTSGLMIVALTTEVYHRLQRQFASREIDKTYVSRLEPSGTAMAAEGEIRLALAPDADDRPRQRVDDAEGKDAHTRYRMTGDDRVELHPLTGRTHQLRVHCAHSRGLGRPILGDPLYGHGGDRLYLHAQSLSFIHPITGKPMTVCSPPPF